MDMELSPVPLLGGGAKVYHNETFSWLPIRGLRLLSQTVATEG